VLPQLGFGDEADRLGEDRVQRADLHGSVSRVAFGGRFPAIMKRTRFDTIVGYSLARRRIA
jgi:hypothetical protein